MWANNEISRVVTDEAKVEPAENPNPITIETQILGPEGSSTQFKNSKFCKQCGKENKDQKNFCSSCGYHLQIQE